MAIKPLTSEAIALTEKKMDMALDDIINMSKTTVNDATRQRLPNKSHKVLNKIAQDKSAKLQRFMNSRSSLRQGVLAQRRSNFQGNPFPLATEVARKAAVAPIQNGGFNHNRRVNWIKPRVGVPLAQRQNRIGSFAVKHQQQQQHHLHRQHHQQQQHQRQQQHHQQRQQQQQQRQLNMVARQKPQTLDSLFANMKEQRMRVFSQQNNAIRRGGIGPQRQQRGRGQFRN